MKKILPFFVLNFLEKRKAEKETKKRQEAEELLVLMNREKSSHNVTAV